MAKLNGIEVPTPCRMVLVRCGKLVSMGSAERPAIVLAERNLTPRLYVLPYDTFTSSFIGAQSDVKHESLLSNDDETTWCWRWPPREEQPAAVVTAPDLRCTCGCLRSKHEKGPDGVGCRTVFDADEQWKWDCPCDDFKLAPSLEERVRQLEALIDEEPTANDKQKERLQRQLERKTIEARSYDETQAKREAIIAKMQEERDSALLRLTNALHARDAALAVVEETKKQLAANDAHHVERFAAETRRATTLVEERDALRLRLAEVERERDEARRVAKWLRYGREDLGRAEDVAEYDKASAVFMSWEVEP